MERELTGYPSIDKPWLKYYSEEAINAPLPECTVYQNIWQHNKEHLEDTALKYYGHKISYGKLFEQVERCARALKTAGATRGDRVTLCMAGVPEAVYLVLACSKIGAVANFLNPLFTTTQMIDRINDTEAELLFVLDKMYPYIAAAIDKTCINRIIIIPATGSLPAPMRALAALKGKPDAALTAAMRQEKCTVWRVFMKAGKAYSGQTEESYEKDAPVVMVYSSGTTGASKGIVLTNDGINATIAHYQSQDFSYERENTFLQIIPVWFSTGIVLSLLMPLNYGITVIPELVYSKERFTNDLAKYRPNMTLATTSLWVYAIQSSVLSSVDLSTMRYPITGGEQVLPETELKIEKFLEEHNCAAKLIKGWGMCELGSTVATTAIQHSKPSSVGYPILGVAVAAFDVDTGKELPYGGRGELRASSPARMKEYYKNQKATDEFFRTGVDGKVWGCTGDIGYVDEDGDVFVLGRASDCYYTPGGERVYLFDAEYVILCDTAVALCKVIDIDIDGCPTPAAHLVLKAGNTETAADIIRRIDGLCRKELKPHAVPQAYKIRGEFPVHTNGKRDNEILRTERDGFMNAAGETVKL